ncbi:MAG: hypothetical protein AAB383_06380 [Patescibacteria group bacterium]
MRLSGLPLVLAACTTETEAPGSILVSDFSETSTDARDERLEAELSSELKLNFGKCEAVFSTGPSYIRNCPKLEEGDLGHKLVRDSGYFQKNYHTGKWSVCEYEDGKPVDEVHVEAYCTDFVHSNGNPAWHPTYATSDLKLEEGLQKDPRSRRGCCGAARVY